MEQKLLQENVAIAPFLEKDIATKADELARAGDLIERMEAENCVLRNELEGLSCKFWSCEEEKQRSDKRITDLKTELDKLKKAVTEQGNLDSRRLCVGAGEIDECSSSQRFQGLIDASTRSNLLKNLRKAPKSADIGQSQEF
ncbi:protein CHUP1, chloroplastic-like [Canna indica]|uniref:Protein CHUP1, chloroplastic-like n=1 Tax=Canna indica TaxID=4628 RepID=A0AAQ3KXE3_9LILI|nr:protein CHUP1, chloroplastic-like [Canna indica]